MRLTRRGRSGALCLGLTEGLLFTAGLLMLGVYVGARVQGIVLSRADVIKLRHAVNVIVAGLGIDRFRQRGKRLILVSGHRNESQKYKNSLSVHFSSAIAVLRIPKIHLETPLLEGTDDTTLNRAVGLIAGTARPGEIGNVGIAGHRDGFFRGLKDVAIGDTVKLVTERRNQHVRDRSDRHCRTERCFRAGRPS